MTALLLALLLCWDPDPDADRWAIDFAFRDIDRWECCDVDGNLYPVYTPFAWQMIVLTAPIFFSPPCAEQPGEVCYYRHPVAFDLFGNQSPQPDLLWPPPIQGGCP